MGSALISGLSGSGILCCVLGQDTLFSLCIPAPRCNKWVPANLMLGVNLQHLAQGGVEILLVASCYRNQDKLRPDGPLGLYAGFTCHLIYKYRLSDL